MMAKHRPALRDYTGRNAEAVQAGAELPLFAIELERFASDVPDLKRNTPWV